MFVTESSYKNVFNIIQGGSNSLAAVCPVHVRMSLLLLKLKC